MKMVKESKNSITAQSAANIHGPNHHPGATPLHPDKRILQYYQQLISVNSNQFELMLRRNGEPAESIGNPSQGSNSKRGVQAVQVQI